MADTTLFIVQDAKKSVSAKNYLAQATKNRWLKLVCGGWYLRDRSKKAVLSVFVEQEIEGIAVCPVPGIPGKVAV